MNQDIPDGTLRIIGGRERTYIDGYWIKTYQVPEDTLQAKRRLIEGLTRRLFNLTEHGLNIPGQRLAEAKKAYDEELDPGKKRVKGAMYAGAMPKNTREFVERCATYAATGSVTMMPIPLPG
jgi:hypothetical protein